MDGDEKSSLQGCKTTLGNVKQGRAAEARSSMRKYTHWIQLSLAAGLRGRV